MLIFLIPTPKSFHHNSNTHVAAFDFVASVAAVDESIAEVVLAEKTFSIGAGLTSLTRLGRAITLVLAAEAVVETVALRALEEEEYH